VSFDEVEFTMPDRDPAPRADFLDLLMIALSGMMARRWKHFSPAGGGEMNAHVEPSAAR
jgi:hypothetical protein